MNELLEVVLNQGTNLRNNALEIWLMLALTEIIKNAFPPLIILMKG